LIRWTIDLIGKLWAIPFLRFIVMGGINMIFGYSVFALFIILNFHYVLAALFAQICGILFNFKVTTGPIVFKNKDNRLLFRFFFIYLITYILNISLLKLFDIAGVESLVSGAIIILPMAFVSFLLMKRFVFINSKTQLW